MFAGAETGAFHQFGGSEGLRALETEGVDLELDAFVDDDRDHLAAGDVAELGEDARERAFLAEGFLQADLGAPELGHVERLPELHVLEFFAAEPGGIGADESVAADVFDPLEDRPGFDGDDDVDLAGDRVPASLCTRFATMDPASSERETADWTVLAVWGITPDNRLLLLDVMREQTATGHLRMMAAAWQKWRPTYIGVEAEKIGTLMGRMARRQGATVKALHPDTDKVTRAIPAGVRVDAGDVWFPTVDQAPFDLAAFEEELTQFPNGPHDDQVDAAAHAYNAIEDWKNGKV
jgi:predicted phage terminase large subunit-like protein